MSVIHMPRREPELRFKLVIASIPLEGNAVPYSALRPGDLTDLRALEDRISRLLGHSVRIETAEEEA